MRDLTDKRPFVLSRSTFVGSGNYTTHWLGDNDATWKHLRMSIIGILEFNMFGIPMVGADICGFFNDASTELCQRWLQLGAFYPFSRNHNAWKQKDKDPVAFNDESLIKSTVEALNIRYSILPFMYTLFYKSHIHGGPVALPLNFEFPSDKQTWDIQEQFLLGSAFLVSPAVHENQREVDAYFPFNAVWYDYRTVSFLESFCSKRKFMNVHSQIKKGKTS
jgi:alpha-glucosidase (family GH31 glycosyl hydrolase)